MRARAGVLPNNPSAPGELGDQVAQIEDYVAPAIADNLGLPLDDPRTQLVAAPFTAAFNLLADRGASKSRPYAPEELEAQIDPSSDSCAPASTRSNRRHRSPDRLPVQHSTRLTLTAGWLQRRLPGERPPSTMSAHVAESPCPRQSGPSPDGPRGPSSGWQCGGTRWSPLTSTHQHISMWTCTGHASRPDRIGIRLTTAPDHPTCMSAIRCRVSAQTVMRASTDSSPGTAPGLPGSPNRCAISRR